MIYIPYYISFIIVTSISWFGLKYTKRAHMREKTRLIGKYIRSKFPLMITNVIDNYISPYILQQSIVFIDMSCGFLEGIEGNEQLYILEKNIKSNNNNNNNINNNLNITQNITNVDNQLNNNNNIINNQNNQLNNLSDQNNQLNDLSDQNNQLNDLSEENNNIKDSNNEHNIKETKKNTELLTHESINEIPHNIQYSESFQQSKKDIYIDESDNESNNYINYEDNESDNNSNNYNQNSQTDETINKFYDSSDQINKNIKNKNIKIKKTQTSIKKNGNKLHISIKRNK